VTGRGYTIFDTGIGRCGIAWGPSGTIGVQLPEGREIDTRRRLFKLYPDARELRAPLNVEIAIEGIAALLRGGEADLSEVTLDMTGMTYFDQRVYGFVRTIPRGKTRIYAEVAAGLRVSGAAHSVAQAIARNPFMIIALSSRARGGPLCRSNLAVWRGDLQATAAVDRGLPPHLQQDAVRRVAARCAAAGP